MPVLQGPLQITSTAASFLLRYSSNSFSLSLKFLYYRLLCVLGHPPNSVCVYPNCLLPTYKSAHGYFFDCIALYKRNLVAFSRHYMAPARHGTGV